MTIDVIMAGNIFSLTGFGGLIAHDGWGSAAMIPITSTGPLQHGSTWLDYRLQSRVGQFVFKTGVSSLDDLYNLRAFPFDSIFSAGNALSIRWTLPYGVRQIDCRVMSTDMTWNVEEWAVQKVGVSLYCADPSYYDPAGVAVSFDLGGGPDTSAVPTSVPTVVGRSAVGQAYTVDYSGTWPAFPIIRLTGPLSNPVITNQTTGDVLSLNGVTIAAGNYVEIDTRYGYKTVKLNGTTAHPEYLTSTSDLATFGFYPSVDGSATRINDIYVTGTAITAAARIDINFHTRYKGI